MNTLENQNAIFPKGEKTSPEYFTGTAWLKMLVPQDETGSYAIGNVVFEPGCRNNWHTHPAGQIRLVTDGKGYYQEKGKPARLLTKGDVVVIPSHVECISRYINKKELEYTNAGNFINCGDVFLLFHNLVNNNIIWLVFILMYDYFY